MSRFVSQPVTLAAPQCPKPILHANMHLPAMQIAGFLVLAVPHGSPHFPQLATSEEVFPSQPLAGLPSQSAKPSLHEKEQPPALHAGAAFVVAAHGVQTAVAQPAFGSSFDTQAPLQDLLGVGAGPRTAARTALAADVDGAVRVEVTEQGGAGDRGHRDHHGGNEPAATHARAPL